MNTASDLQFPGCRDDVDDPVTQKSRYKSREKPPVYKHTRLTLRLASAPAQPTMAKKALTIVAATVPLPPGEGLPNC
uniref:Uncharacterized protein n=1 Tax=Caenorhabditis japonica TaxID=281687 RepID=A0A8R1IYS9_CAEJA